MGIWKNLSCISYISNFRKGDLDKYIKIENIERLIEVIKGRQLYSFQSLVTLSLWLW